MDETLLRAQSSDCASQQVFEALALVVAMRLWCNQWRAQRCTVRVRSDSVCALTRVLKLRGSCYGLRVLAREAALDVSAACYRLVVAEHIPVVTKHLADRLSRRTQPGEESAWSLPLELSVARERSVLPRSTAWYRSCGPPRPLPQGKTTERVVRCHKNQSDDFPCLDVARLTWCLDPREYGLSLKNVSNGDQVSEPRFCHRLGE